MNFNQKEVHNEIYMDRRFDGRSRNFINFFLRHGADGTPRFRRAKIAKYVCGEVRYQSKFSIRGEYQF